MKVIKIHITKPDISEKLSEFVGIMLGDGSMSRIGYTTQITLNKTYEKPFLSYISKLIFDLFRINPRVVEIRNKNVIALRLYSCELFDYMKELGLSSGKIEKQIPEWVYESEALCNSCIRGLFDTEGSVFLSSRWCVMNFKSSSRHILNGFKEEMRRIGIPIIESGISINATSLWKIKKFFYVVGSSNLKHIIKFIEYVDNKRTIRSDIFILPLLEKYKNTKLPFYYKGP